MKIKDEMQKHKKEITNHQANAQLHHSTNLKKSKFHFSFTW